MSETYRISSRMRAVGLSALVISSLGGGLVYATAASASTNVLTNGSFEQPGTNNTAPTGWTPTEIGAETKPYSATIDEYNASGQYPPPAGDPDPSGAGFASEVFYEAGTSTGVEGFGGEQSISGVDNTTDAQVSYDTAQSFAPSPSVASWAGSIFEVDFTSGSTAYELRFFSPFTPVSGSYSGAPTSSSTVAYVTEPTLTSKTWSAVPSIDLSSAIQSAFGLSTYSVTGVVYGVLEGTTSSKSPYPDETAYFDGLSLVTSPPAQTPEVPFAPALPVAGVALLGLGYLTLRRRGTRALG